MVAAGPAPMVKLTFALAIGLLLAAGGEIYAQNLHVAYIEGTAEIKHGGDWSAMAIGQSVATEATIHIDPGAYVELSSTPFKISLNHVGTYSVSKLLALATKVHTEGVRLPIASSLSSLFRGLEKPPSTSLGARGANESTREQNDWVTSDTQVYLEEGRDLIAQGDYAGAVEQLKQALEAATPNEVPQVSLTLGCAYSLGGDTRQALKAIVGPNPTGGESWAADFVLLQAKLQVDTNAFGPAVEWLTQKGASLAQDAQRGQIYYFLLALGYRVLRDTQKEQKALAMVISIEPHSELGRAAAELAASL